MKRRRFLATSGIAAVTALAGCLGGKAAPPRRSTVVDQLQANGNTLVVDLVSDPTVESREDFGGDVEAAGLSPVGVAAAAKGGGGGGRGATGRASGGYSKAPKRNGRAVLYGGPYGDDWRDDHEDEIEKYDARVQEVGYVYFGTENEFEDDKPGPGEPDEGWDRVVQDPKEKPTFEIRDAGWHRVGTNLEREQGSGNFGWECIDFKTVADGDGGYEITKKWKVSPRL